MKKSAEKRDEIKTIAVASCIAASVAVAPSPLPGNPEPSPPAPLVDFEKVPQHILKKLLANKSIHDGREHPITFGTDAYADKGNGRDARSPITTEFLRRKPYAVRARVEKSRETQTKRTKSRAEVFTPSWLCKKMVDYLDTEIVSMRMPKASSIISASLTPCPLPRPEG